jgi:hypothetical protein
VIIKPVITVLLALQMLCVTAAANSADTFKQLGSMEIRSKIVGNVVTDQAHWADRFMENGTLREMSLGIYNSATWRLDGNAVCITRKTGEPRNECFEIWASGDKIEYRRGGITLMSGVLRDGSVKTK